MLKGFKKMKFSTIMNERHYLDPPVSAARNLTLLTQYLDKKYKNDETKIDRGCDFIQSYLSALRSGTGKSVHQKNSEIQQLFSALTIYYDNPDEKLKKFAIDEYSKVMKKILNKIYSI